MGTGWCELRAVSGKLERDGCDRCVIERKASYVGHHVQCGVLYLVFGGFGRRQFERILWYTTNRCRPVVRLGSRCHRTRCPIVRSSKKSGGVVRRCGDDDLHSTTRVKLDK